MSISLEKNLRNVKVVIFITMATLPSIGNISFCSLTNHVWEIRYLILIKKNEEPSQTWRSPTWRPSLLMPCTQSCLELRRGQSCLELRRGVGDLRNSSKQCLFTNIWASANSAAQGTFIVTQGTSWDSVLFATCLCLSASQPITSLVFKYFI